MQSINAPQTGSMPHATGNSTINPRWNNPERGDTPKVNDPQTNQEQGKPLPDPVMAVATRKVQARLRCTEKLTCRSTLLFVR